MISKDELLILNTEGFIPGPGETEERFLNRVRLVKKLFSDPENFFKEKAQNPPFELEDRLKKPDYHWAGCSLLNLFDISGRSFLAYFNNDKLRMFQGAATWILDIEGAAVPLLQLKKNLKKGSFLGIYSLEDILAHELAHFARAAFNEPKYEEFFAYMTSSKVIRKLLGPIASSSKEIIFFLSFIFLSLFFQYLGLFYKIALFDFLFITSSLLSMSLLSIGFLRLGYRRYRFNKCYKKLFSFFKKKEKTMAVMFRLTDDEIKLFSKKDHFEIKKYILENKEGSLRWRVIYSAYFESIDFS